MFWTPAKRLALAYWTIFVVSGLNVVRGIATIGVGELLGEGLTQVFWWLGGTMIIWGGIGIMLGVFVKRQSIVAIWTFMLMLVGFSGSTLIFVWSRQTTFQNTAAVFWLISSLLLVGQAIKILMKIFLALAAFAFGGGILYSGVLLSIALVHDDPSAWWMVTVIMVIAALVCGGLYIEMDSRIRKMDRPVGERRGPTPRCI